MFSAPAPLCINDDVQCQATFGDRAQCFTVRRRQESQRQSVELSRTQRIKLHIETGMFQAFEQLIHRLAFDLIRAQIVK